MTDGPSSGTSGKEEKVDIMEGFPVVLTLAPDVRNCQVQTFRWGGILKLKQTETNTDQRT